LRFGRKTSPSGRTATRTIFSGITAETTYTGAETHAVIDVNHCRLRIVGINRNGSVPIPVGRPITFTIPPESIVVLED
jgi:hypothetical protein